MSPPEARYQELERSAAQRVFGTQDYDSNLCPAAILRPASQKACPDGHMLSLPDLAHDQEVLGRLGCLKGLLEAPECLRKARSAVRFRHDYGQRSERQR